MRIEAAAELAAKQFGALARWQLLDFGFSESHVRSWIARGRLHRTTFPGVYAWGRRDLPSEGKLATALLFAGGGSALTGLSCLWWLGLLHREPEVVHLDAPGFSRSRSGLWIRHPKEIRRREHNGIPVVHLPRALLVASTELRHDSLRLVLGRAEYDRDIPFSLQGLEMEIRGGPVGSKAVRAAMDAHLPQLAKCENGFERDFVLLCERFRLPIPEPNVRIGRYRPNMLWEDARLIVELDGKDAHTTPAQLIHDTERQEWLEARGYTVIRFTWAQVQFRREWVAAEVRRHLT